MATQQVKYVRGTAVTFTNTGGDKLLNAKALGAATGRLSAFYDRGAAAETVEYEVRAYGSWAANPTVGSQIQVAIFESDGTHQDCGVAYHASNDAALTLAEINAAPGWVGGVTAHTANTTEKGLVRRVRITSRHFAVGLYNSDAAQTLANTDSVTAVVVTPLIPQIADV